MAYTIRKISNEEKRDTPDMRFFNYSSRDKQYGSFEEISDILKGKINPQKLSKYNKILILDEYSNSGESLTNTRQILKNYFANSKKKPKIHFASLQHL